MGLPRSVLAAALASAAVCTLLVLVSPTVFFVDDAWFYLQIAHNLAAGHGSTFSGALPTNGYHPLWLLISAVLALGTGLSRELAVSATVLLQGLVLGTALLLLLARLTRQAEVPHAVLTLAVVGATFYGSQWYGSEAWINGLAQVTALSLLLSAHARPTAPRWLACGALFGIAVLARLDLVFLAGAAALSPLADEAPVRERLRRSALLATGCAVVLAPYLFWNLASTGHLTPISGTTKSTFPLPEAVAIGEKLGTVGAVLGIGAVVGGALATQRRLASPALRRLLAVTAAGGLAQVAYVALFTRWGWSTDQGYYYVTALLCTGLAVPVLVEVYLGFLPSLGPDGRRRLVGAIALVAAVGAPLRVARNALDGGLAPAPEDPAIGLARWMGANLPPDATVFTFDAPGRLAWFSGLRVIAADGLTADHAFDGAVRDPDLAAFFERHGVGWVVAPTHDYRTPWSVTEVRDGAITVRALGPRSGAPAGTLSLRLDEATARLEDFAPVEGSISAALFRWRPPAR